MVFGAPKFSGSAGERVLGVFGIVVVVVVWQSEQSGCAGKQR